MADVITTWVFARAAESVRLARITATRPQLLVIGPGCRRHVHLSDSEEELGMVQLAVERQLHCEGWSYEGCITQ